MTHRIVLTNKSKNELFFKFLDSLDDKKKTIKAGEATTSYLSTNISNLYIYKKKEGEPIWEGTVPTNTNLEIFEDSCNIVNVYLDNNKIPSFILQNSTCKKKCNSCSSYVLLFIFLILLILKLFVF